MEDWTASLERCEFSKESGRLQLLWQIAVQLACCLRLAARVPLRHCQPNKSLQSHPAHLLAVGGANHHCALVGGVESIQVAQQHAQHAPRRLVHLCSRVER